MSLPFDQSFKLLGEDDDRGALALLGDLPLDADAQVKLLDRELNLSVRRVDQVYRVTYNGETFLNHFEATTNYSHVDLGDLSRYSMLLDYKYDLPVFSRIVVLTDRGFPQDLPKVYRHRRGSNDLLHQVSIIGFCSYPVHWRLNGTGPPCCLGLA